MSLIILYLQHINDTGQCSQGAVNMQSESALWVEYDDRLKYCLRTEAGIDSDNDLHNSL